MRIPRTRWTRGRLLRVMVLAPVAALVAACNGKDDAPASPEARDAGTAVPASSAAAAAEPARTATAPSPAAQLLPPTPQCADDDEPTVAQTEGPYFTPNSPQRTSLLEPGMNGTRMIVSGLVLSTDCRPIAGALLDFWQCDDAGEYDNRGFRLRGHQFTDQAGRYQLETIVPGVYPGRTRHLHVKVQAPGGRVLTTQQYFPNEPGNARDGIFDRALVMAIQDMPNGKLATFNYVLRTG